MSAGFMGTVLSNDDPAEAWNAYRQLLLDDEQQRRVIKQFVATEGGRARGFDAPFEFVFEEMAREAEAFLAACVICASCQHAFDAVEVSATGYRCPECDARVCLWCGCTDEFACDGGCGWVVPGICSVCEVKAIAQVERLFEGGGNDGLRHQEGR